MSKVPGHKFRVGVTPTCQCGWKGATFFGKGARKGATWDWQSHVSRHAEDPAIRDLPYAHSPLI